MIELQQVSKSFGRKTVLDAIQCVFEKGKIYGLVGENGAGKTTLFRCIADLENFEGKIISDKSPRKNYISYLFSDPYFLPKITAAEYIYLLTEARNKKVTNLADRNIFGLPLQEYAQSYSTGMQKKLALTAILLQDSDFYILDEPYNGIDLQSSILLTEIIHQLKARGKTVLISSHIFATLKETCDEILVLENGKLSAAIPKSGFNQLEDEMKEKLMTVHINRIWDQ